MELFKIDNKPHRPFYVIHDKEFGLLQVYYDLCFECWMFFHTGNGLDCYIGLDCWDKRNSISDLELLVMFSMTLDDVPGVLKYMDLIRSRETRITAKIETVLWYARHQK